VSLGLQPSISPHKSISIPLRVGLFLLLCVTPGLSQKTQLEDGRLPGMGWVARTVK
jgi:hypothetical protein